jgi:hypothetical protein
LAASRPGALIFVGVRYDDLSDVPSGFEVRIQLPESDEIIETFVNYDNGAIDSSSTTRD